MKDNITKRLGKYVCSHPDLHLKSLAESRKSFWRLRLVCITSHDYTYAPKFVQILPNYCHPNYDCSTNFHTRWEEKRRKMSSHSTAF